MSRNPFVILGQVLFLILLLAFGWKWALGIMLVLLLPIGVVGAIMGFCVMLFAPAKKK